MSLIINIDTALENAHVSIAEDGKVLQVLFNGLQKEHASFLHAAIQKLLKNTGIQLTKIDAVAVTAGPGSYTGLRVGLASAKGLCYALKKPLITLNTLEVLTVSVIQVLPHLDEQVLLCPMIDARRMEVFTAIYQKDLAIRLHPCALILDESSYSHELSHNKILFFGNGSDKWKATCRHPNAQFEKVSILPESMSKYAFTQFLRKNFTELAYSEPFYLKDFHVVSNK